ncbi:shikimate dehydrogenase [Wielerella bovis]|uniref:shikimate dehydrogenase n=1 Tax=Wielerella bovis TaxID=2917790 RepID=UPI002018A703|nr:shikimate dehydrogenase [Wielerella bovis]ULJ70155.1 shikimate dehydrogenase [Wielerella bovis]
MTTQYTVFGNPIAHSKSPQIHSLFAAQEQAQISYTRTLVENNREAFQAALNQFFANGGCGANVTLPFKEHAFSLCDALSKRAQAASAVNTLIPQSNGTILGDNTDGIGLVSDLRDHLGITLSGCRILILGAGGAARGVILPLLSCEPERIVIANRTHSKAIDLANQFGIHAQEFATLKPEFDLIINATSGSVSGDIPPISPPIFSGCLWAYDMFYSAKPTAFLQFAAQHGAQNTADGLGMLVAQAAAAYQLWRGFTPQIAPVIATLRAELSA